MLLVFIHILSIHSLIHLVFTYPIIYIHILTIIILSCIYSSNSSMLKPASTQKTTTWTWVWVSCNLFARAQDWQYFCLLEIDSSWALDMTQSSRTRITQFSEPFHLATNPPVNFQIFQMMYHPGSKLAESSTILHLFKNQKSV